MAKKVHKSVTALYVAQMKRMRTMRLTIEQSVEYMKEEAVKDTIALLGGRLSRSQTKGAYARGRTAAMSTPTGRKRGRAPLLPINMQTGRLRRSITSKSTGRLKFTVVSRGVRYAKFILSDHGTRKMVTRPLKKQIGKNIKQRNKALKDHFLNTQRAS